MTQFYDAIVCSTFVPLSQCAVRELSAIAVRELVERLASFACFAFSRVARVDCASCSQRGEFARVERLSPLAMFACAVLVFEIVCWLPSASTCHQSGRFACGPCVCSIAFVA